ncbi:hypothetical protein Leryth_000633 [Lithospermum erythrorhizon]|nr:hypothetical protein Leryth_000633 [Lithospermum erythrorhizon]
MADEQDTTLPVQEEEKAQLKYLEFVKGTAIYAIVCFITLYEYAKDNSGPLKPGVNAVEGSVKAVTRPVYNKFHHVPFQLLKFIDCKIGETIMELDHRMPTMIKRASYQLLLVVQKAPEVAREVVSEVEQAGLVDATSNIVKRVYMSYEPAAEKYAVSSWSKLNELPLFPIVAHIVVPTAAYWAEKYNQVVATIVERGYTVSCYLPLIPIDKIAKAFENNVDGPVALSQ